MAKAPDFTKMMQDAASAFQVDTKKFEEAFKSAADRGEKLSKVALDAAGRSAELSSKWTSETLSKLGEVAKSKEDLAEYGDAFRAFAQAQASMMQDHVAAFAEIAKKVQNETIELMMNAAKEVSDEAQAAVKAASEKVRDMAEKAGK